MIRSSILMKSRNMYLYDHNVIRKEKVLLFIDLVFFSDFSFYIIVGVGTACAVSRPSGTIYTKLLELL